MPEFLQNAEGVLTLCLGTIKSSQLECRGSARIEGCQYGRSCSNKGSVLLRGDAEVQSGAPPGLLRRPSAYSGQKCVLMMSQLGVGFHSICVSSIACTCLHIASVEDTMCTLCIVQLWLQVQYNMSNSGSISIQSSPSVRQLVRRWR